jgi:hypothetical protein
MSTGIFKATKTKAKRKLVTSSSLHYETTLRNSTMSVNHIHNNNSNITNRIPSEIVPLHMQCLHTCTTFFEEYVQLASSSSSSSLHEPLLSLYSSNHSIDDDDDDDENITEDRDIRVSSNRTSSSNTNNIPLLESLFRRIDETKQHELTTTSSSSSNATSTNNSSHNNTNTTASTSTEIQNFKFVQRRKNSVISSWLQSIHQYIRNQKHHPTNHRTKYATGTTTGSTGQRKKRPTTTDDVAITLTKHLLDIVLSMPHSKHHPKKTSSTTPSRTGSNHNQLLFSEKRAATLMLYQLLQKSSVSRQYFFGTDHHSYHCSIATTTTKTKKKQSKGAALRGHPPATSKLLLLLAWMDTITSFIALPSNHNNTDTTIATNSNNNYNIYYCNCIALQQESFHLLQSLQQQFHTFYPTLSVAVQRFQQQLVSIPTMFHPPLAFESEMTSGTTTSTTAITGRTNPTSEVQRSAPPAVVHTRPIYHLKELRQLRDIAIRDSDKLQRRLRVLIHNAYTYLDHFVPRFVNDANNNNTANHDDADADADDDDDDDGDSIEWEDGNDNNATAAAPIPSDDVMDRISHLQAVEHTIATIQSGVLFLQEDQMNIDFATSSDTAMMNDLTSDSDTEAKQQLQHIIHKLHRIYTKHLSVWIYALTHADHLRPNVASVTESSALYRHMTQQTQSRAVVVPSVPHVRMLPSEMKQQQQMLEQLVELQKEVENVFRSSKQLGLTIAIPPATTTTTITDSQPQHA